MDTYRLDGKIFVLECGCFKYKGDIDPLRYWYERTNKFGFSRVSIVRDIDGKYSTCPICHNLKWIILPPK